MKLEIPSAVPENLATLHRWLLEAFRRSGDSYGGRNLLRIPVGTTETKIAHGLTERPLAIYWAVDGITRVGRSRADDTRFIYLKASTATTVDLLIIPGQGATSADVTDAEDVVDNEPAREGSIFSMVGPLGATTPVVAYDFTQFDPTATNAARVTAANKSSDSSLDLSVTLGAVLEFLNNSTGVQGSPHALRPFAASVQGGALFTGSGTDFVNTTGAPIAIRFLGAMTAEWCGYFTVSPGAGDVFLYFFNAAGETEAANSLYQFQWTNAADQWAYLHEAGAGVDSTRVLFASAVTRFADMRLIPQMITMTRDAAGVVRVYWNGALVATAAAASPTALPTGGTTSDLTLGYGGDPAVRIATLGFRLFGVELTEAQALESYTRTMFGRSAT